MKAGSRGNQGGDWPWKGEKEIKNVREPPGSFLFWLGINYGLFILAFFTLGLFSENPRIAALNVALDGILCAVSLVLNIFCLLCAGKRAAPGAVPVRGQGTSAGKKAPPLGRGGDPGNQGRQRRKERYGIKFCWPAFCPRDFGRLSPPGRTAPAGPGRWG